MVAVAEGFPGAMCEVCLLLQGQSPTIFSNRQCDLPQVTGQNKTRDEGSLKSCTFLIYCAFFRPSVPVHSFSHLFICLSIHSTITNLHNFEVELF